MRGVGQLALASTDPARVAEFYESAFGFRRLAAGAGAVDLELGGFERPVIIHYAIYGSFERWIGILTEHFGGAFPFWLAPVQVMVVPIADRHLEYAGTVRDALSVAGLRAEVDDRSERMQAKLREAQEQKIPVMVVVGDRDQEAGAVSPRLRTGESQQGVPLDEFVAGLKTREAARELWPYGEGSGSGA